MWPRTDRHTGRKLGAEAPFWAGGVLGTHLTQCGRGRGLPPSQVSFGSMQPFGHNTPTLQADRQTDNGPIAQGESFYKRSPKN